MTTMPDIRFAKTSDGIRIAYTVTGEGETLVCTPGWVSNQELEWQGPNGEFHQQLAQGRRLVLFDGRGTGLSDRHVEDVSVAARVLDLHAVVQSLDVGKIVLFGVSQWTPVAILFAAQYPEIVSRLILYAPFIEHFIGDREQLGRALLDLIRAEWGVGARTTMSFVHPDADREEEALGLAYLGQSSSGTIAARILEEGMFEVDVKSEASQVQAPTLVLHRRDDNAVPMECGREAAALLPQARFVPLEGDHHLTFYGDSGTILRAIDEFLGVPSAAPRATSPTALIQQAFASGAPVTVLFTDMAGSTALTGRLGDAPAQELLRDHDSIVRDALSAHGGREVKHTGDGIMASFASASRALESAIQMQRALTERNEAQPEAAIQVRVGLNAGEPVREQDDLFGTAVQLARRICDRAEPGQILASNVVRELVAGKGFLFAEFGETELRGFEDPIRLYEVRWAE